MNKKYSCIAQIFVGLVFVWLSAAAQACMPLPLQPSKPLDAAQLEKEISGAQNIMIGTLEKYEKDPVLRKTLAVFRVEKPVKAVDTGTHKIALNGNEMNCGLELPKAGETWLYFYHPARQPPEELLNRRPPLGKVMNAETGEVSDESPEEAKAYDLYMLSIQYGEKHSLYLLKNAAGEFFPEDAKLIKEKFGYDIAPKSGEVVPSP